MLQVQSFNNTTDKFMSVVGVNVTRQIESGVYVITDKPYISVTVTFFDLSQSYNNTFPVEGSGKKTYTPMMLEYNAATEMWLLYTYATSGHIGIDFSDPFWGVNRKYTATISDPSGDMISLILGEFVLTDGILEAVTTELPYRITINQVDPEHPAKIEWYDRGTGDTVFYAPLYKDGVGMNYATNASNITHRGAIKHV